MGHTRLGQLPQTRKWREVVELVASGADVAQVANATIKAAETAFSFVSDDSGYNHAVWLMTQLGLAHSHPNPLEYLRENGINIPENTSLPGIAVALTDALDGHFASTDKHSDLGELAQRALIDAVIRRLEPKLEQGSVGAGVEEFEFVKESQKVMVNGRQYSGPLNVVRRASLGEISFVDLGADGATSASVAANAHYPTGEPIVDEPVITPQDDTSTSPAPQPPVEPPAPPAPAQNSGVDAIRAQQAAETDRIAEIRRICAGRLPAIESRAIREGWSAQRTELEMLRNQRPAVAAVHVADNTVTAEVLEAACCLSAGLSELDREPNHQAIELAERRFRGGIGLQELLLEAAWANGYTGRNFRDSRSVLRYAFGHTVEAAFSNIDIGGILSNVANKFLLEGFFSVERTWRNICAVRNVSDFKTVTSYRLVGKDQYELVAPGGELKQGTLGNESYTNRADTYPRHIQIHYGQYKREQLFDAARRSRACAYLADDDHGPLALQEILLAGCPTVGVRTGAAFVRDGITGFWVEKLPPGRKFISNDEERLLLKVYIDLIAQAQALVRSDVRNRAIEQFHSDGIVTELINCLSGLRSTGGIASAAIV